MSRRKALWLVGCRRVVALLCSHVAIVIDSSLVASPSRCVNVFPNGFRLLPHATFTPLRTQFIAIVYLGICVCVEVIVFVIYINGVGRNIPPTGSEGLTPSASGL